MNGYAKDRCDNEHHRHPQAESGDAGNDARGHDESQMIEADHGMAET